MTTETIFPIGTQVTYRSLTGGDHPARVVGRRPDGTVDLEVITDWPWPLLLSRIKIGSGRGECFT